MNKWFSDDMGATGYKVTMIITGGGMTAATESTKRGGASKWFQGAYLPYDVEMTKSLMGVIGSPKMVSPETADALVQNHREDGKPMSMCIASTSKLTYEGEREGRSHEAYIALSRCNAQSEYRRFLYHLEIELGDRLFQENIVSGTICNLLLHHSSSDEEMQFPGLELLN